MLPGRHGDGWRRSRWWPGPAPSSSGRPSRSPSARSSWAPSLPRCSCWPCSRVPSPGSVDDGPGFLRSPCVRDWRILPVPAVTASAWSSRSASASCCWSPWGCSRRASAHNSISRAVGSSMAFGVQGVRLGARVTSLRQVDWQSLTTNFFVTLSPGTLDGAPTSYVATARVAPNAEAAVQDAVVQALPNVTAIPLRDVLERLGRVLDQMAVAVRTMALFAISPGLVVMAGALGASRYQRLSESVILRTLGATRSTVARVFAVEYACLGLAAGVGGSVLAAVLALAVLRFVLDAPWVLAPLALALGLAVPTAVALAVGSLSTWRLLGEKPLPVLRRE